MVRETTNKHPCRKGYDHLGRLNYLQKHDVFGELLGEVGLPSAAGTAENNTPVLQKKRNVPLDDSLGYERLKDEGVDTLLKSSCNI